MTIKILGAGSPDSRELAENTRNALKQLNKDHVEIEMVSNINKIVRYKARTIPALVVNDHIVGYGTLMPEGIKKLLTKSKWVKQMQTEDTGAETNS